MKIRKKIFIILILFFIMFLKTEANAATYGIDYFGEEYSNGYIGSSGAVISTYGVSIKTGKQINSRTASVYYNVNYYTNNNTSKSAYIDYSKAARYINSNGEAIWLDMRLYIWSNSQNYSWSIPVTYLAIFNLYNSGIQHTTVEIHFYTTGHCGDSNYEQQFKGVTCMSDLDKREGCLIYSGYNQIYLKSGIPTINIFPGNKNSTNSNNPFSTSGTAQYPYFFGTRENNGTDNVWMEINSKPNSPFKFVYGTRNTYCRDGNILSRNTN